MAYFILFLILIFVVFPVVLLSKLFGGIFKLFRRRQSDSSGFFGSGRFRRNAQSASQSEPKRKKKVFDRNDGEYVEFEEIIEETTTFRASASGEEVRYETEEQVSDAEWIEIK